MSDRRCEHCDAPIAPGSRARYCTPACRTRAWNRANRERKAAYGRAYAAAHREKRSVREAAYRQRKRLEAQLNAPPRHCAACGEQLPPDTTLSRKYCGPACYERVDRERDAAYRAANREKIRAANRQWNKAHPEKMREIRRAYEARQRAARAEARSARAGDPLGTAGAHPGKE